MQTIDFKDFEKIELRIGTIVDIKPFEKARNPSYKIWVDLGIELGIKKSSAQLIAHYQPNELLGKQVICVCNFKPRQIADFMSEILITGFDAEEGGVIIGTVDRTVPNGSKLY